MILRRQHSTGEDVFLDKVGVGLVLLEGFRLDSDDLEPGRTAWFQALLELGEVSRPIFFADGLEHLDRDDPVIKAGLIAIILKPEVDKIPEACLLDPLLGEGQLLAADRKSRYPAADFARCIF